MLLGGTWWINREDRSEYNPDPTQLQQLEPRCKQAKASQSTAAGLKPGGCSANGHSEPFAHAEITALYPTMSTCRYSNVVLHVPRHLKN